MGENEPPPPAELVTPWATAVIERSVQRQRDRFRRQSDKIVAVVEELTREVGDDFTVAEVLRRARTSRTTFDRLFGSKDAVLYAAIERGTRRRHELYPAIFERFADDPRELLRALLLTRWTWVDGQPVTVARLRAVLFPRLLVAIPAEWNETASREPRLVAELIGRCRAAGLLAASSTTDEALAGLINSLLVARVDARVIATPLDAGVIPSDLAGFDAFWEFVSRALFGAGPGQWSETPGGRPARRAGTSPARRR